MNRLTKDYNVDSILLIGFTKTRTYGEQIIFRENYKIKSPDDLENLSGTLHYFNFEIKV
jgi:hypothetical protein